MAVRSGRSGVRSVIGWDIGGANVKAAHVSLLPAAAGATIATVGVPSTVQTRSRPFEVWKTKEGLPDLLRALAEELPPAGAAAVTMTAELSDAFRTKREGVAFVLDAVRQATRADLRVFTTGGAFVDEGTARERPLEVAASNWMATARLLAGRRSDALLVDVGSTTTDVTLVRDGRVDAVGRTDPDRLVSGELVYTGALRTNVAAILPALSFRGRPCGVASEYFAVSGDAHLLLGDLAPADYTIPTPDGRPATPEFAAERLARVVCADVEMLGPDEIVAMAREVAAAQTARIAEALRRVAGRAGPADRPLEALVTGLGGFLGHRAAVRAGLPSRELTEALGVDVGLAAPAVAVAWLLAGER